LAPLEGYRLILEMPRGERDNNLGELSGCFHLAVGFQTPFKHLQTMRNTIPLMLQKSEEISNTMMP